MHPLPPLLGLSQSACACFRQAPAGGRCRAGEQRPRGQDGGVVRGDVGRRDWQEAQGGREAGVEDN